MVACYLDDSANPDDIIDENLLSDSEPLDVTVAAQVQMTTHVVLDVRHHLSQDRLGVRHCRPDLTDPVVVVLLLVNHPRAVTT